MGWSCTLVVVGTSKYICPAGTSNIFLLIVLIHLPHSKGLAVADARRNIEHGSHRRQNEGRGGLDTARSSR
jgi:hypothetical protein